jgi:hypothetical protein
MCRARCPGGTPLAPATPLTIQTPTGSYVRTDNASSTAYPGTGSGGSPPEQYMAYHSDNPTDTSPIDPYEPVILQSVQTGLYCRLAPLPSNASQTGMVCDQASPATATPLTYTGDGLSYNGIALVSPGPGLPLVLENSTSPSVAGPTADNLTLAPALTGGALRSRPVRCHHVCVRCAVCIVATCIIGLHPKYLQARPGGLLKRCACCTHLAPYRQVWSFHPASISMGMCIQLGQQHVPLSVPPVTLYRPAPGA